jgi:hypothetical protein
MQLEEVGLGEKVEKLAEVMGKIVGSGHGHGGDCGG